MQRVLVILIVMLALVFPWRLAMMAAEALWMEPTMIQQRADHDHYWDVQTLEARLKLRYAFEVKYVPGLLEDEHVYGMTMYWPERVITIDAGLSWSERWRVLTHEAGHVLQPMRLSNQGHEVWAESVSMLLAHDGIREHARYLAELKADVPLTLLVYWQEIYRAADQLSHD